MRAHCSGAGRIVYRVAHVNRKVLEENYGTVPCSITKYQSWRILHVLSLPEAADTALCRAPVSFDCFW
jgi:hypothetical protein